MNTIFNGNTINQNPVPIVPSQQIVIPPITLPSNFNPSLATQSYKQFTAKGKEAAKKIKLGPKSTVAIFDEDEEVFYYRETDENGNDVKCETYMYTVIEDPPEPEYLTVQEFKTVMADFAKKLKEDLKNG